jgi:hypothetical protein
MIDTALVSLILVPVLAYFLSRKPGPREDVFADHIVPPGIEERPCLTHWAVPAGVSRFNSELFTAVKCHPDFVERDIPEIWFKWSPADARKRARKRLALSVTAPAPQVAGVLPIRKEA